MSGVEEKMSFTQDSEQEIFSISKYTYPKEENKSRKRKYDQIS